MPCSGTPSGCATFPEGTCQNCGCDWNPDLMFCWGEADICSTHDANEANCIACGCDWTAPGVNIKVNYADVWGDGAELWINIGDVWKKGAKAWINIGDVWEEVF